MTAGVEGLPTGARDRHDDRQHRSSPDCWCKPVAAGIGWRHR